MLDEAEEKLGLLHNAKFFSVDLQTEAQPDRAILVDQSFAREFRSTWDSATTCHAVESPDQELGPGVIAIWYGRAEIDAVPDPSTGSLTFTQTGRQ